jgi:hypothetical protein
MPTNCPHLSPLFCYPTLKHIRDDIAFTKPIRRLNRSSIMVSQQCVQCYDAIDDTAFWHAAEADCARLIVP